MNNTRKHRFYDTHTFYSFLFLPGDIIHLRNDSNLYIIDHISSVSEGRWPAIHLRLEDGTKLPSAKEVSSILENITPVKRKDVSELDVGSILMFKNPTGPRYYEVLGRCIRNGIFEGVTWFELRRSSDGYVWPYSLTEIIQKFYFVDVDSENSELFYELGTLSKMETFISEQKP